MMMKIWVVDEQHKRRRLGKIYIVTAFVLIMLFSVSSATRPFGLQGKSKHLNTTVESKQQGLKSNNATGEVNEACKELSTLGSRPPKCEHKCGGCSPCEAIQVPTTTDHVGVQYTNYEPEGWKCKCGPTFYNP
ncbi:hypothetical protein Syun_026428 [Stephania yunnanensis]|uniref:Epidermal patterning factor-like protein n=1 Tax=Stephania yunnanensis TaxID=152371 RepID=A0AAP0F0L2_9MAGN